MSAGSEHVYETDVPPEGFWSELRLRSPLARAAFAVAVIGAIVSIVITLSEAISASRGPLQPDVKHGLIVPFNNHGVIHFISQTHSLWLDTSFAVYFPCFITVLVLGWRARRLRRKGV